MIVLSKSLLSEMEEHARKEKPNEACGILVGRKNTAERIYSCKNVSENPSSCYAIAPDQLLEIFNDAEDLGLEILGFYHSHPAGPSGPSGIDLSSATWHNCSYVILHQGGVGSWIWDEVKGQFIKEEIRVI